MSSMPQATESERIMAQAQSMIDEASKGLVEMQQAWKQLGIHGQRITAAHDAAIARGAPGWMAQVQRATSASPQGKPTAPLQHHETRRERKQRFML